MAVHAVEDADIVECVVARPAGDVILARVIAIAIAVIIKIGMRVRQAMVVPVRYPEICCCVLASGRDCRVVVALAAPPRDVNDRISRNWVVRGTDSVIDNPCGS